MITNRLKSIIGVSASNVFTIIVNVAISFIIPIFLSILDYSQFRVFTFYSMYFPLLHFGFIDAILIIYAGKSFSEIESSDLPKKIKSYGMLQLSLLVISIIVSFIFVENSSLIIPIILFIFLQNANLLFDTIYRTTKEFNYYTRIKFLNRGILFVLIILTIFTPTLRDLSYYIYAYIFVQFLLLIYNLYLTRKIIFFNKINNASKRDFFDFFKIGFPIVGSYIINLFIIGLARIFIENYFPSYDYAIYSFAYSIVSIVISIIISFSAVIYPLLHEFSEENRLKIYGLMGTIINTIFSIIVFMAPIIGIVVSYVLPTYSSSIIYILLMLPLILYNVQYIMKILNYFYLNKKQTQLIVINIVILIIGISSFFIAVRFNIALVYYSIISSLILLLLVIVCEAILRKVYNFHTIKDSIFYISAFLFTLLYLIPYGEYFGIIFFALTIIMYSNELKLILKRIRMKIK